MKNKEYVTVTKDGVTKTVEKDLLQHYISAGWVEIANENLVGSAQPFAKYGK